MQWGFYEPSSPSDPNLTYTRKIDAAINRKSEIIHWYPQWDKATTGSNSKDFSVHVPFLATVKAYGAIPMLTWEPWGAPLGDIIAGRWDPYIDSWARGLAAYGGPVYLRFAHEADWTGGNAYPWSLLSNTAADIIAATHRVHDRFVLAKATNVQHVWAVNVWSPQGKVQASLYPGDAYCDWMGIDIYNWAAVNGNVWSSLAAGLTADAGGNYATLSALSGKPMMLSEWASAEPTLAEALLYSKGQWIKDAAAALATQFPRIIAAVWFSNTNQDGTPSTFSLDSSADSLAGAKAAFGGIPPVDPVLTAITATRADIAKVQRGLDALSKHLGIGNP